MNCSSWPQYFKPKQKSENRARKPARQAFPGLQHTWLRVSKNHEPLRHNNSNFQTHRKTRGWVVTHFEFFLFFFKPWNDATLKNCFIKIIKLVECDYEHKNLKVPFSMCVSQHPSWTGWWHHCCKVAALLQWQVYSLLSQVTLLLGQIFRTLGILDCIRKRKHTQHMALCNQPDCKEPWDTCLSMGS